MKSLIIDRQTLDVERHGRALLLRFGPGETRKVPITGLERVIVRGSVRISTAALSLLWEQGISFLALSGRQSNPGPRFDGYVHNDAAIRVGQCLLLMQPAQRRQAARELIMVKFRITRLVMQRLIRKRRNAGAAFRKLKPMLNQALKQLQSLDAPPALDSLRGIEGSVASAWFAAYQELFPASLGFAGRKRRPPPDPVNAALSLGYTLAVADAARRAVIHGLDPAIGAFHALAHGRDALALDLVEPARPIVDEMVHDLFHARRLTLRHFHPQPGGGMLMGKAARRAFYEAWDQQAALTIRPLLTRICRHAVRRIRMTNPLQHFREDP